MVKFAYRNNLASPRRQEIVYAASAVCFCIVLSRVFVVSTQREKRFEEIQRDQEHREKNRNAFGFPGPYPCRQRRLRAVCYRDRSGAWPLPSFTNYDDHNDDGKLGELDRFRAHGLSACPVRGIEAGA